MVPWPRTLRPVHAGPGVREASASVRQPPRGARHSGPVPVPAGARPCGGPTTTAPWPGGGADAADTVLGAVSAEHWRIAKTGHLPRMVDPVGDIMSVTGS
ncbi:hypothetical protein GCM10027168_14800 [Streptomyces capparidis]